MVLLAAVLFSGLGLVAVRKAESATKIAVAELEESGAYLQSADTTRAALLRQERGIRYGIIGVGVLLCLGLGLFGVVSSHRVAGPLYRLGVELGKLRDGSFAPVTPLRKGDQLTDLYESFRKATDAIRAREQRDVEVLRHVLEAASQEPTLAPAELARLRARLQKKEAGLG
jgi:nitrogen fixation/metabolism regulation signal transduction histidine kinase